MGIVTAEELTATQLKWMDVYFDGSINGLDIAYLMKVVALKYRFLSDFIYTSKGNEPLTLMTTLRTADGKLATADQTSLEIGTALNFEMDFAADANVAITNDGVNVETVHSNTSGAFETVSWPKVTELHVGITAIVKRTTREGVLRWAAKRRFTAAGCWRRAIPSGGE